MDFKYSEQKALFQLSSHRPTDVDGLATQVRTVAHRFPRRPVSGWLSELAKAYKQVSGDPAQLRYVVVAQWCPTRRRPILWLAQSQLFGRSRSPQQFSRYPAWMCE